LQGWAGTLLFLYGGIFLLFFFQIAANFIVGGFFLGLLVTVQCKNSSRLRGVLFSGYTKVDARHKP
jgi:hypothetical protein